MKTEPVRPQTGLLQLGASAMMLSVSVFLLVIVVYTPGNLPFFHAARNDADYIADVTHNIAMTYDADPSFAVIVNLFNFIGSFMDVRIFLALVGCLTFWAVYRSAITWFQIFLAALWISVSIISVLNAPGKDVIVVCLIFATAILIRVTRGNILAVISACVLYALYAWIFRSYYILIISVGMGLFLTTFFSVKYQAITLIAAATIVFTAGGSVVTALQESRDVSVSSLTDAFPALVDRTAIRNPSPPDTLVGRVNNFGFATLKLFFPLIWGVSSSPSDAIKDLLFNAYSISLLWVILTCLRSPSRELLLVGSLLVGSVFISILFEPDIGSFARHSCSMFPFLLVVFANAQHELRQQEVPN